MITLHFARSHGFFSWLIRLFTFSRWNHTAIEIDGTVFDATGLHGVSCWSPDEFRRHYHRIESYPVPGNPADVRQFLSDQLGKSYDWKAVVALPFREDWQEDNRWFCSELSAAALNVWPDGIPAARIKPHDLYLVIRSAYAHH